MAVQVQTHLGSKECGRCGRKLQFVLRTPTSKSGQWCSGNPTHFVWKCDARTPEMPMLAHLPEGDAS
jgi:hypothetical protein